MWYFVYIVHTHSLCTRPVHLKRPHFACSGLLNENLWEVVVLPQGRSCSTLVIVCYITAITVEERENVSGWCLKVLSGLCFERRSVMVKVMSGYINFQRYHTSLIYTTVPVWILHKCVLFIWAFKTKLYILWLFFHLKTVLLHILSFMYIQLTDAILFFLEWGWLPKGFFKELLIWAWVLGVFVKTGC